MSQYFVVDLILVSVSVPLWGQRATGSELVESDLLYEPLGYIRLGCGDIETDFSLLGCRSVSIGVKVGDGSG